MTFAFDPAADRAYTLVEDQTLACDQQTLQLVTVDFATGSASKRDLGIAAGQFGWYNMALDPTTHKAAIVTSCQAESIGGSRTELTLLDLSTGATTRVFQHLLTTEVYYHAGLMIGGDAAVVGIDPVNHLVLQRSMLCPTVVGDFDLNARVCLNEYDEAGRLVKTIPGLFSDGDIFTLFSGVNGATRTGATAGQEIGSYFASTAVQPYAY